MTKHFTIALIACLPLAGCGSVKSPWVPGSSAAAAQDQIMLVRREPPSFGYLRLSTQVRSYPDIGAFVVAKGVPDFLAETGDSDRRYFILYYLKPKQAFACRTSGASSSQAVEFAGPYPITPREFKLLDDFRNNSNGKLRR